jgi:hypothetical protein
MTAGEAGGASWSSSTTKGASALGVSYFSRRRAMLCVSVEGLFSAFSVTTIDAGGMATCALVLTLSSAIVIEPGIGT